MTSKNCVLIGAPVDCGKRRQGCLMGPDAYRVAEIVQTLRDLGHSVEDMGNLTPSKTDEISPPNDRVFKITENVAWTKTLSDVGRQAAKRGVPIFLGGDHALSLGSVAGMAAHAADLGRPLFVLWLDAHTDFHTPETSGSGNLHGTPLGYVTGRSGFESFPELHAKVPEENVCLIGLRSVDLEEHQALSQTGLMPVDMRAIDEHGIAVPLRRFLDRVAEENGLLHVSFDVDFLDPSFAPAVGTTVPGGATLREAHLVMEILHDSGLVSSLDLVELNPALDERGKTAHVMVDLTASLFGRRVFDRPTFRFA